MKLGWLLCLGLAGCAQVHEDQAVFLFRQYGQYGVIDKDGDVVAPPTLMQAAQASSTDGIVLWDENNRAYAVLPDATQVLLAESDETNVSMVLFGRYAVIGADTFPGEGQGDRILDLNTGRVVLHEDAGVVWNRFFTESTNGEASRTLPVFELLGDCEGILFLDSGDVRWYPGYEVVSPVCDGSIRVRTDEGYGYISPIGRVLIAPQFASAGSFQDGLALVRPRDAHAKPGVFNKKWRGINKKNQTVFEVQVHAVSNTTWFSEGLVAVIPQEFDDRWGYMDTHGELAIPGLFQYAKPFSNGVAIVKLFEEPHNIPALCDALDCDTDFLRPRLGKWVVIDHRGHLLKNLPYTTERPSDAAVGRILFPSAYKSPVNFADGSVGGINCSYLVKLDGQIIWSSAGLRERTSRPTSLQSAP